MAILWLHTLGIAIFKNVLLCSNLKVWIFTKRGGFWTGTPPGGQNFEGLGQAPLGLNAKSKNIKSWRQFLIWFWAKYERLFCSRHFLPDSGSVNWSCFVLDNIFPVTVWQTTLYQTKQNVKDCSRQNILHAFSQKQCPR